MINARFGLATRLLGLLAATPMAAASLADVYTSADLAISSGGKTTVGWKSTVSGSVASWQDITVESQVAINGDLLAGGTVSLGWQAQAGAVSESLTPADFAGLALPAVDLAPSGLALTSISQYETRALAPGTFGDLSVDWRGSVTLSAGDYYFDQLSFGSESQLVLDTTDGAVTIHVAGDADFAWQTVVSRTADDGAAALIVGGRVGLADQIDFGASSGPTTTSRSRARWASKARRLPASLARCQSPARSSACSSAAHCSARTAALFSAHTTTGGPGFPCDTPRHAGSCQFADAP